MNHSTKDHALAIGLLPILAILTTCTSAHAADQPNIILCMGDDHGWDETAYNGNPHLKTPVLDKMAATGLRMDRFYSAHPSCSPTRGSVITGRHPNRYGTLAPGWSIRPEEISVAQILKTAGYTTGHFGKWHLGPVKDESPTNPGAMGFDQWVSHDNFFEMNPVFSRNGGPPEPFKGKAPRSSSTKRSASSATQSRPGDPSSPSSGSAHPTNHTAAWKRTLPSTTTCPRATRNAPSNSPAWKPDFKSHDLFEKSLRERYAEITAMDRSMGTLRDYLDSQGLRQNTLLWYCGDNGTPRSGAVTVPFRGLKGEVFEGGVRVPGIIEWPAKIPAPRVTDVNAVTSDILPTLCDIVGQPLPDRPLDGISLLPLIDGNMIERPTPICFWNYNAGREAKSKFEPYIDPKLQEGTTPLVKQMAGRFTRDFKNFRHPAITEQDFTGSRAILGNRYKLVIEGTARKHGTESPV